MNVLKEYILVAITQSVLINPEALLVCARLGMLVTHLKDALVNLSSKLHYYCYFGDLQHADINECVVLSNQVLCHECQNTIGSYKCLCDEGYMNKTANETFISCEGGSYL